jgi:two-component system OmpR family sensor kinase
LVTGVVALVAMLVVAIGATTYYALRSYLNTRLDQQLNPIATTNQIRLDVCAARGADECSITGGPSGYRAPQAEWLVLLDGEANQVGRLFSDESVRLMRLSEDQRHRLVDNPGETMTLTTTDGHQLRVSSRRLTTSPDGSVVVTGLSTDSVNTTLRRLVATELVLGAAAVAVALAATTWGVRRSLRNLYRVTGTAQEVAAELSPTGAGLDRRVPVAEEGTEVGQLAESFNTMLAAVETQFTARVESEQRMRQFLADASHELRTPLTSIRGYAELARMQRAAGDTAQDNLDRIESEGTRMSRLVDDLLMLARGDADQVQHAERAPVDVGELLDDAVTGSRAAFPDRPISLEFTTMPAVLGDRDQLLRVVRNLITNAAVHTEAGRPIEVRGTTDIGGVVIRVIDGGPGLPPEAAAHVFERFWRADKARTRARGGSGLGLSIVATVVRAHGGTVRFDSDVARGSTVTVRLPVTAAPPPEVLG